MSYRVTPGGSGPPIYEKERAVRMARKLGLRIISTSRDHGSTTEQAKASSHTTPSGERPVLRGSPSLSFTARSNCR